jgi:L-rhamnose mutarotase
MKTRLFFFHVLVLLAVMAACDGRSSADQRWWKETDPCQIPLPPAAAKGKIWTDMKEVYFLP